MNSSTGVFSELWGLFSPSRSSAMASHLIRKHSLRRTSGIADSTICPKKVNTKIDSIKSGKLHSLQSRRFRGPTRDSPQRREADRQTLPKRVDSQNIETRPVRAKPDRTQFHAWSSAPKAESCAYERQRAGKM